VHKFLRDDSEIPSAGTREARSVSITGIVESFFSSIVNFAERHTSFDDLHIAFSE
jgi:hypothetical protein